MSIIDNAAHSVVAYDPKASKPFTGQRLAKVTFKTVTDKESPLFNIKRESKCVSLPLVTAKEVQDNAVALSGVIAEYLMDVQNKIVRERVEANAAHITSEEVSIAGCIEWLEQNNESGRLTKESVGQWFVDNIETELAVVLADKLGVSNVPTDAENKQIMAVVNTFKDKVSSLAGGKTSYEPKLCESLIKAIAMAPAGDALAVRFTARLEKMIAESKAGINLMDML